MIPDQAYKPTRAGIAAMRRHDRLLEAAKRIDQAWDAWMEHEEGEGQEDMEQAIAHLREVLRNG